MTPEEIQRIKDLLPTTLGSEEIRGTIAAGEHVAVSIANDDGTGNHEYIEDATNLRLRVVDPTNGKTRAEIDAFLDAIPTE